MKEKKTVEGYLVYWIVNKQPRVIGECATLDAAKEVAELFMEGKNPYIRKYLYITYYTRTGETEKEEVVYRFPLLELVVN